jgi:hypothetical protein
MLTRYSYGLAGLCAIVLYFSLFAVGLVVDSNPLRTRLASAPQDIGLFLLVLISYTPTNVAFLGILAGFMGGCASLITYSRRGQPAAQEPESASMVRQSMLFRTESPLASMFRSVIVYFGFMAGILAMTVSAFANTTPDQYARLATTISFFSFAVGYDPTKLQSLIGSLRLPAKPDLGDRAGG